jgi:enterochelin esterase-like enzyme
VLKKKGYDLNYIEVPFGHEWENWGPLQDDMLRTFFSE